MTVTINSIQAEFHLSPPKITFLQGADMTVANIRSTLRQIEESTEGRMQPTVAAVSASGLVDFSEAGDGSLRNALTIRILSPYVVAFESGAIAFASAEGNLLATSVDSPGAIVKINNAVGAVVVDTGAGDVGGIG